MRRQWNRHPKNLGYFLLFYRPEEIRKMGRFKPVLQTLTRNNSRIRSVLSILRRTFTRKMAGEAAFYARTAFLRSRRFTMTSGIRKDFWGDHRGSHSFIYPVHWIYSCHAPHSRNPPFLRHRRTSANVDTWEVAAASAGPRFQTYEIPFRNRQPDLLVIWAVPASYASDVDQIVAFSLQRSLKETMIL